MPFAIKLIGGPEDGSVRMCDRLEDYGLSWPLPDELSYPSQEGKYIKVQESSLSVEDAKHPNIAVGATFEWKEKCLS